MEDQWQAFSRLLLDASDKLIPRLKRRTINRPQWLSGTVKKALNKKAKLWKKYKKSQDMKHLDAFKEQRKLCKNLIRNAMYTFEKCLADKIKENPKAFYSYSRSKLKQRKQFAQ